MIYHEEKGRNFTIQIKTRTKKWVAVIHRIPFHNKWWHLLFTWNMKSGISLYINGNFAIQTVNAVNTVERYTRLQSSSDEVIIGCTNQSTGFSRSLKEFGHFDFGHFAIWDRVLMQTEIELAYKASIFETRESLKCCERIAGKHLSKP